MSTQADALLSSMTESNAELGDATLGTMVLGASAYDSDVEEHIVIQPNRYIIVPEALKRIAVQHDHNIETVTFDCPRYWDEHDMSEMKIYINYIRADNEPGSYPIDNGVTVDEENDTIMHFDWTITNDVTQVNGNITFLVCVKKVDDEGNEENHWNSELNNDMYVSKGLETQNKIINKYPDLVTHLLTRMDIVEEKTTLQSMLGYLDEYFATDAAINDVLMHYVEDYLQTDDDVTRTIADTVNTYIEEHLSATDKTLTVSETPADAAATGKAIKNTVNKTNGSLITDSVDGVLAFRKLYGKSEQNTVPGNQLLDTTKQASTDSDTLRIITYNEDGSTTITNNATSSAVTGYSHVLTGTIPAGTYTLSVLETEVYLQTVADDYSNLVNGTHSFTYDGASYLRIIGANINASSSKTYKFMLNAGETALEWEPYVGGNPSPNPEYPQEIKSAGDDGVIEGAVYSGNLMNFDEVYSKLGTNTEITMSYSNRKLTMTGTPTAAYRQNTTGRKGLMLPKGVAGKTLYFGATLSGNQPYVVLYLRDSDGNQLDGGSGITSSGVCEIAVPENAVYYEFAFCLNMATTGSAYTATFSDLYLSLTNDGYKKYVEPTDISITTPNGLYGVKTGVAARANYTDPSGQMWICDEIDLKRGVYIQRIKKLENIQFVATTGYVVGNSNLFKYSISDGLNGTVLLCNVLPATKAIIENDTNGAYQDYDSIFARIQGVSDVDEFNNLIAGNVFYYPLATPIETPLTSEQISAFREYSSYGDGTNILFDSVVPGIEVDYPRTLAASYILENQKKVKENTESIEKNTNALGGWSIYPEELTQAQYDALDAGLKATPKLIFVLKKE